jgi:hypothetical protein
MLNIAEASFWLFAGKKYFVITDLNELHSFGFAILFFTGILNIIIIRTPIRFYKQPIGKILLFAILADIVLAISILTIGVTGFTCLPIIITGSTFLYFILCTFLINDWVKVKVN